ncbi:hypothetical protein [Pseudogemmobacter humi]|uniref:Uncharacterized protein n=1 Tax=Pseudogemmobacter humi TaxID=2483812 RepID=A0A3P5XDE9_9RHOB|nr:hypothetical protein [Pseudogemmobacter humi]VDC28257.1 hypothetical protein XINFAN_02032 [Pseudogemmobacter humi]
MTQHPTFAQIVSAAKRATPGGRLNDDDRAGLMRRAANLGLSVVDANAVLDNVLPRHPITRGIE